MAPAPGAKPPGPAALSGAQGRRFLLFAFTVGWAPWVIVAALEGRVHHTLRNILLTGPALFGAFGALGLLWWARDPAASREFFRSAVDLRRSPKWMLAAALLTMPLVATVAVAIQSLFAGGAAMPILRLGQAPNPGSDVLGVIKAIGFGLLVGPVLEEMAWRGFALPRMQRHYGPVAGALWLCVANTLWHLPLFFVPGTSQEALGLFTAGFWLFLLDIASFTVVAATCHCATGRSTLSTILLHSGFNGVGIFLVQSLDQEAWRVGAQVAFVLALALATRGRLFLDQASIRPTT